MSLGVKYCLKKKHELLKGFYSCRRSRSKKTKKKHRHRRTRSPNHPPKSFDKRGVRSFLKEIWLLSDCLCGIFCSQTEFSDVHMETGAISSFRVLARLFLAQVTAQGLV